MIKYRIKEKNIINIPLVFLFFIVAPSSLAENIPSNSLLQELANQEKQFNKKKPSRIRFLPVPNMSDSEILYIKNLSEKVEKNGLIFLNKLDSESPSKTATVSILLNSKGEIISSKIDISSGDSSIDVKVIEIIKLSSPFGDLPKSKSKDYKQMHISRRVKIDS